jgi:hypothetical protein
MGPNRGLDLHDTLAILPNVGAPHGEIIPRASDITTRLNAAARYRP